MRSHLEKLLALLAHKRAILEELVERQEGLKAFLIRPRWHRFFEFTQPQEALLQKLRQIQAAQDFLMQELACAFHVHKVPNLRSLCRYIEADWQRAILDAVEHIREVTLKLRGLTRLSQALNQAHWQYLQRYMAEAHNRPDLGCTYTANGSTASAAWVANSYSSSV